jgi:hypothetical protein
MQNCEEEKMKRLIKMLHVLGLVMFFGSILSYISMGFVISTGEDVKLILLKRQIIHGMTWTLTMPGLWLLVITGVIMAIQMKYGFCKTRWLTIKQAIVIVMVINATFFLAPFVDQLLASAQQGMVTGTLSRNYFRIIDRENKLGALNLLLCLCTVIITIFKPFTKKKD